MGIISDDSGNYVMGKMQNTNAAEHVIYNDKNITVPFTYQYGTNTSDPAQPLSQELNKLNGPNAQSVNCVNWYYETDYDLYVNKGSVAAVNTYIQGIFNNVATLYDNDGISIALRGQVQGLGNLLVIDITGRTVMSLQVDAEDLSNEFDLNITDLKAGVYAISYHVSGHQRVTRFVKNNPGHIQLKGADQLPFFMPDAVNFQSDMFLLLFTKTYLYAPTHSFRSFSLHLLYFTLFRADSPYH